MKLRNKTLALLGGAVVVFGMLGAPAAATASPLQASVGGDAVQRVPAGPCSQQQSGMRSWFEWWGQYNVQNCNSYAVSIEISANGGWLPCTRLSPGQTTNAGPLSYPHGSFRYC
jgi:hypothetical protein